MRWFAVIAVLAGGCESIPSSGRVFQPVVTAPARGVATPALPAAGGDEPLVPGEAPAEHPPPASTEDPLALRARLAGVAPEALSEPPAAAPAAPAAIAPLIPIPVQVPVWDPGRPPEASMWGMRLLTTLSGTLPARAVLVLPDGAEIVVRAGDMIPEHRVVVWAVGRDRVELAHVSADGAFARVETKALQALMPAAR
ncbi:MAG: hypothetical protein ACI8PZ_000108 [Myxococcota bacterium]|jgi:hypothetical protein